MGDDAMKLFGRKKKGGKHRGQRKLMLEREEALIALARRAQALEREPDVPLRIFEFESRFASRIIKTRTTSLASFVHTRRFNEDPTR